MIFTARQLQALHQSNGQIILPYRARLTPLAVDWVRAKKISLGYSDVESPKIDCPVPAASPENNEAKPHSTGTFLWWCDGPCGPAKAAVMAQSKESSLSPLTTANDPKQLVAAVRFI